MERWRDGEPDAECLFLPLFCGQKPLWLEFALAGRLLNSFRCLFFSCRFTEPKHTWTYMIRPISTCTFVLSVNTDRPSYLHPARSLAKVFHKHRTQLLQAGEAAKVLQLNTTFRFSLYNQLLPPASEPNTAAPDPLSLNLLSASLLLFTPVHTVVLTEQPHAGTETANTSTLPPPGRRTEAVHGQVYTELCS